MRTPSGTQQRGEPSVPADGFGEDFDVAFEGMFEDYGDYGPQSFEPDKPADPDDYDDYQRQARLLDKMAGAAKALVKEPVVLVSLVVLLVIVMFVRAFLVPSASMRPTLMEGDRILSMACYFPNGHTFKQGDIVCFMEKYSNEVYVKRVVACGGDVVEISGENVYVNGELSPYQGTGGIMTATRIELADDEYWVMGDNRGNSQDSRFIGPVKADQMISKVWCVYWPVDRFTWFGI